MNRLSFTKMLLMGAFSSLMMSGAAEAQFGFGGNPRVSESYIAVEVNSGKVLYALNADKKRPIASLTKVATAMVVIDWSIVAGVDLGTTKATVPAYVLGLPSANPMNLQPGEQVSLRDLLYSALLGSDNIAAETLAHHVGSAIQAAQGKYGQPVPAFIVEMNRLGRSLGMQQTQYRDVHGLGVGGRQTMSTASDQALLAMHARTKEPLMFIVRQAQRDVTVYGTGGVRSFKVHNTNALLGKFHVVGLKTGTTAVAGQCFTAVSERGNLVRKNPAGEVLLTPRSMVTVVLGSADRYTRTESLLRNGWASFDQWSNAGFPVMGKRGEFLQLPFKRAAR